MGRAREEGAGPAKKLRLEIRIGRACLLRRDTRPSNICSKSEDTRSRAHTLTTGGTSSSPRTVCTAVVLIRPAKCDVAGPALPRMLCDTRHYRSSPSQVQGLLLHRVRRAHRVQLQCFLGSRVRNNVVLREYLSLGSVDNAFPWSTAWDRPI